MGRDVIDDEHLSERHRQMHEPLQINRLRALKFSHQSDQPEKKKHQRHAQPDTHHDHRLRGAQSQGRAEQAAEKGHSAQHHRAHRDDGCEHRAEAAGALPLIAREPPAQPEYGLELLPVQSRLQPA